MPAWSPLRAVRASLFAAVCVTLALAGHALMADTPVPGWAPAAAFLVLTAFAWVAAGRERGLPAIAGSLVGAQLALHTAFGWAAVRHPAAGVLTPADIEAQWLRALLCNEGAPPPGGHRRSAAELLADMGLDPALASHPPSHVMPPPGQGGGHTMHAMGAAAPDATHAAGAMLMPVHGGVGMLLAHLAAAFGSAVWLWRGEQALFGLLHLLASRAASVTALLRAWLRWGEVPFPRLVPVRPRASRVVSLWACRPLTRRGPPRTVPA